MRIPQACRLILLLTTLIAGSNIYAADERPNFVFFIADDISVDDLGCYGHKTLKTPQIDRLADNGMRFTNAYLTISSCSPSRCSIITGRYPHNTGAPELHTKLPEDQPLFPLLLKDAGYYTVLSGKHHMGNNANPGFTHISGGKGPGREEDWVPILQKRPKDQPFFCWFASTDAHRNWAFDENAPKYTNEEVVVPPYMVDSEKTRQDLTGYYHEVSRFDHFIGKVADELKKQGVLENTVIIVIADNGRPLPRCKTRLYDSGIKTPMVLHFPAMVKASVNDQFVSVIDISATILDLAKVEKDERIQGQSFRALLTDPQASVRDVVFAEHNWHVYQAHERMVRTGDYLYIRNNFPERQNRCMEAFLGGAGEDLTEGHKNGILNDAQLNIFRKPCPAEELFHVGNDPHQLKNLADDPKLQPVMKKMRELLAQWTTETGDNVPENPTPDRGTKRNPHAEMPGKATGATQINHPGPTRVPRP